MSCSYERSKHGSCGPEGKYFRRDPFWEWYNSVDWAAVKLGFAAIIAFFVMMGVLIFGLRG